MDVFKARIEETDLYSINEVLRKGQIGFGPNVAIVEERFGDEFSGYKHNTATNSASAAAFMIFAYLKEKYGQCDVYTPSIGFISPVWAAKHHGHNIIWVDVDHHLLFDMEDYRKKRMEVRSRRRNVPVLMPILYGGVSYIPGFRTTDEIVVIDSAHCVTPTMDADYTFFSFHAYKPLACSDGGMISTHSEEAEDYFRLYRNFGRSPTDDGYDIIQNGFKFYMNNLNATILLTQMNSYYDNLEERKRNFRRKADLPLLGRLLTHDTYSSYYFGTIIVNPESYETYRRLYKTQKHYPLLHKTSYFADDNGICLENTEKLHPYIVNIPLYNEAQI